MTEDLEERLRETLRARADDVRSPADAWSRYSGANVTSLAPGPDRRLLVGIPAAVIAVAAALVVALVVSRPAGRSHQVAAPGRGQPSAAATPDLAAGQPSSGSASASPAAPASTAATLAAGPAGGPVPAGFQPGSVTFVSPTDGWALGSAACAAPPCTSIVRTRDGGATWVGVPAPRAAVAHLRFADALDGWAFGTSSTIYATHDGGASWSAVRLPAAGQLQAIEAGAGLVHAVVIGDSGPVRILTSPVRTDGWTAAPFTMQTGAGPVPHAQLVLSGTAGWVVEVDRTVVGGARLVDGTWTSWQPPSAQVQGPAVLAASSATELVAVCEVGQWSSPQGEHLFVSPDGGGHFTESSGPADPTTGSALAATPAAGRVVLGGEAGGHPSLVATFDGGSTWSTVYGATPAATGGIGDLGFTTPLQGVAVLGDPGQRSILLKTGDGGHSWTPVTFTG